MDEDRSADPARRARLLSPPSGQPQAPHAPALPMDLSSQYQRRFAPPLFLQPAMAAVAPSDVDARKKLEERMASEGLGPAPRRFCSAETDGGPSDLI